MERRHVPDGCYTDSAGYEALAGIARSKGPAWRGVERYLTRRAHDAAVAAEREKHTARTVIEAARRDALVEYRAVLAELDEEAVRAEFAVCPVTEAVQRRADVA